MSWFRKKGKYWYFVEIKREYDPDTLQLKSKKEVQHYIGDDQAVLRKLLPNKKQEDSNRSETDRKTLLGGKLPRRSAAARPRSRTTA